MALTWICTQIGRGKRRMRESTLLGSVPAIHGRGYPFISRDTPLFIRSAGSDKSKIREGAREIEGKAQPRTN
jgi:hypothetical protein